MLYYDFNRKEITNPQVIAHRYGDNLQSVDDETYRNINIYPILEEEPEVPDGWHLITVATVEELINEGPLFVIVEVEDEQNPEKKLKYAKRLYRVTKYVEEQVLVTNLQVQYVTEIEPLLNKTTA